MLLDLEHGALATSGDSRRYLLKDGIRYGHILNPLYRVARPRLAAFSHRCGQQLHGSRVAIDAGHVAGCRGASVSWMNKAFGTGCLNDAQESAPRESKAHRQSIGECRPQSKRRPRMAFTIRWSVAAVAPMPTPMLISQSGRDVEVGDDEDLLLLVVHRRDVADRAVVGVPLEAAAHHRVKS